MGSVLDSFIFEELKGELRRLQHLGEKVIMPKVVHLMQWKEDADKRLEHADKRLGVRQPVQKLHSRQLEEMRADVANEVRVWAKTEIEKISRDVDTLKSFVRATIERMKLEEAKKPDKTTHPFSTTKHRLTDAQNEWRELSSRRSPTRRKRPTHQHQREGKRRKGNHRCNPRMSRSTQKKQTVKTEKTYVRPRDWNAWSKTRTRKCRRTMRPCNAPQKQRGYQLWNLLLSKWKTESARESCSLPERRTTIGGCQCSKGCLNLCLGVTWQLNWITTRTLCRCCLRAILAVMGGVAAQMRVLLIPRRTIASMVIVVNIHIC